MLAVTEYHSLQEIEVLRHSWDTLWAKTAGASFAQSYAAFESVCRRTDSRNIKVLLVTLMGKPIGVVPLIIHPVQTPVGKLRALRFPMQDWFNFYGVIGAHKTIILQAAIKHLKKSKRDWDYLDLQGYEQDGRESERIWNAGRMHELRFSQQEDRAVPVIGLNQGWYAYWTKREAALRERVSTIEKRLEQMGKVKLVRSRTVANSRSLTLEETAEELTTFKHLSQLNNEALIQKYHGHTERRGTQLWRFIQDIHADAVKNAAADWSVLYLDDEPIAAAYGLAHQGDVELLSMVVSPKMPQATKQLLLKMLLEDGCVRGDSRVVLSAAVRSCGREFCTSDMQMCRLTCQPMTSWKVHAWKVMRLANRSIGQPAKSVGFCDEQWSERRKSNSAELSIDPGSSMNVQT